MKAANLTLALLFSVNAFAQSNEYIIKNNGDTITGEVKILAKQIKVLKTHTDTVTLNSEDVRLYVKDKTVKPVLRLILYGYSDNIEEVQTYNYRNPVYDTTILLTQIITREKLNLFTGKDKRKVVYFFIQRAGIGQIDLEYRGGKVAAFHKLEFGHVHVTFVQVG